MSPRRRPGGDRRDGPLLEQEQIVRAALDLIRERGLDGMTMRRLGDRLNVSSMAIYWYFANKDELVAAVTDYVFAQIEMPDEDLSWTEGLRQVAREVRSTLVEYPGIADQLLTHLRYPASLVPFLEYGISILRSAGFDLREAAEAFDILAGVIVTRAHVEAHQRLVARQRSPDSSTVRDRLVESWHRLDAAIEPDQPGARSYVDHLAQRGSGPDLFERMVDLILTGLATELDQRERDRPPTA